MEPTASRGGDGARRNGGDACRGLSRRDLDGVIPSQPWYEGLLSLFMVATGLMALRRCASRLAAIWRPSPDLAPVFKRVYVRFEAYKTGFLAGCRPFIGLDGCHLKGLYGGKLLSTMARDGNDNMFPVAVAVVEAETRDSWSWFLTKLIDDIGCSEGLVFISDRQKGLVESFEDLLPTTEHRVCMRHLHANLKKKWGGKEAKDHLWNAARAGTLNDFDY
ncbi:hypothetical protein RJ639_037369 [Escallonia herrerae]|uniref:MULE transposase domain-containing protein n=1 Tax=Escallonia herrerae TaxID=1293975 RepID=A0AA88WXY9_9ASTE|nr:hypothetical protein RJ639_037369 [Escallonia herrerae]